LRRAGYRVTCVSAVNEALRVVAEDAPKLVITDLQLEESDGFELAERVKGIAPNMPILLLTGVLFDRVALQASVGSRISGYLEKTAPLSQILAEVQRLTRA
jgi:CheY-like chemotaxis protein